jgi:hypothetical protein
MKTVVYTYIAYKIPFIGSLLKPFIHFYTRRVIEQDVWIMDVQGRNLDPNHRVAKFMSTPADEPHLQIERLRQLGILGDDRVLSITKSESVDIYI